jgi:hypothetical protein
LQKRGFSNHILSYRGAYPQSQPICKRSIPVRAMPCSHVSLQYSFTLSENKNCLYSPLLKHLRKMILRIPPGGKRACAVCCFSVNWKFSKKPLLS